MNDRLLFAQRVTFHATGTVVADYGKVSWHRSGWISVRPDGQAEAVRMRRDHVVCVGPEPTHDDVMAEMVRGDAQPDSALTVLTELARHIDHWGLDVVNVPEFAVLLARTCKLVAGTFLDEEAP